MAFDQPSDVEHIFQAMSGVPKQQPQDPGAEEQPRRLLPPLASLLRKLEIQLAQLKQDLEEEGYRPETLRAFTQLFQELSEEFDNYLGNQKDLSAEEQRRRLLSQFANHLRKLDSDLERFKQDLEEEGYGPETLRAFARQYQELKEEFQDYLEKQTSRFYAALLRSKGRLGFARQIKENASVLAKRFEDYAKRPDEYSWTNIRDLLQDLAIPVSNLLNACEAAAEGLG